MLPCKQALLLALALLLASPPSQADERVRVALLPLVIHSSEGREFLQRGMTDMLVSRLARDQRLAVIPVDDASTATTDAGAARKAGLANDAAFVIFGSFTRFGEGASVDLVVASVHDAEREPRKLYVHADSMGALIPLLDGIASRAAFAVAGADPGAGAASGPDPNGAATSTEVEELRRRIDALERADPASTTTPEPSAESDSEPPRRAPGLPSDAEGERAP